MTGERRSVLQLIETQAKKWQMSRAVGKPAPAEHPSIITLSREPGSGGKLVAAGIADALGYDLFHQEMIHEMAKSADVSRRMLETLDEKGLTVLDEWIASLVDSRHLWPDRYLQHLMRVVGTIGKHGHAVLVGRGANFILPPDRCFRLRIIAPRELRVKHVATEFSVSSEVARRRVLRTESDRKAFIRKYFLADIADAQNYDMILNTGSVGIDAAVDIAMSAKSGSWEKTRSVA
jgi:cytidylate kinase